MLAARSAKVSPFIVFSLPRSRSAWMSVFLSHGGHFVGHDIGTECEVPEDFLDALTGKLSGTCETGAMFAWRLLRHELPDCKFVVIRRPRSEVIASLGRFGLRGYEDEMKRRDELLDQISALPETLTVKFSDLASAAICKQVFEFCLHASFDRQWWSHLSSLNIQVDMRKALLRLGDNHYRIEALKSAVNRRQSELTGGNLCPALA